MHKQMTALLAAGGSPGKLARLGKALGDDTINIITIGGGEWRHYGPVAFMIDKDTPAEMAAFETIMEREEFPWLAFRTVKVTLADTPGELGKASKALGDGDVNIYGVAPLGLGGGGADVGFGVRPLAVRKALKLLTDSGFTAVMLKGPGEPDDSSTDPDDPTPPPWMDAWDQRTEDLLPLWEDQRFFKLGPSQG